MKIRKEDALQYHFKTPKGKIEVIPTKPVSTQRDLSLAYSPGVAYPCLEIYEDPSKVYDYTIKGNLVAVLTNGTAVLGLGNLGPEASKPVMEGKGVLFKKFAGIDVFDIEIKADTVEAFVAVAKALEPTFGGINLEDIKAPESFEIERRLRAELKIPVMHDDQHGTAIISAAALINALKVAGKKIEQIKMVVSGAGASAIACCTLYQELGMKLENIFMYDSKGLVTEDRTDLDASKARFCQKSGTVLPFEKSLKGMDIFLGLSKGDILLPEWLLEMNANPIVFALANPDPEITPERAHSTRSDVIMATGRSDYPNQVNNVLGFPYIFRGALDVRATEINEAMKIAASKALAALALEPVPEVVHLAYSEKNISFGSEYLIPKPVDPRLITTISTAVARAAMESGVAKLPIADFEAYEAWLKELIGQHEGLTRSMIQKAQRSPKRVVFAEASNHKILKAAQIVRDEGIAIPILLGNKKKIEELIAAHQLDLDNIEIYDPGREELRQEEFGQLLFEKRRRKGMTLYDATRQMNQRNYYGTMMVETGQADAFISGLTKNYPDSIRPAMQCIGKQPGASLVAGLHIIKIKKHYYFFADTTVNRNPKAEDLVEITRLVRRAVRFFNVEPRIAMLSYSNFGSNLDENTREVIRATEILHEKYPDLIIDGDIQANVALSPDILNENYGFSKLAGSQGANTFIFPNLMASNIAYKLIGEMAGAEVIGPVLLGMKKPVHILQLGSSVREIVSMVTIAVIDAQTRSEEKV